MSEYQLEIKQIVDYPRCRIYREFIQTLIADRSIRTNNGCSGLFYFTVLCSYANFRTSYRRLDGISYTVYPGEWICRIIELKDWLRLRTKQQALNVLYALQEDHLIEFTILGRDQLVKYKIKDWRRHNTVLDYNCPCQKETGFFFLPVSTAAELVSVGKCSEMDLWYPNDAYLKSSNTIDCALSFVRYAHATLDGCSFGRVKAHKIFGFDTVKITQGGATEEECRANRAAILQALREGGVTDGI